MSGICSRRYVHDHRRTGTLVACAAVAAGLAVATVGSATTAAHAATSSHGFAPHAYSVAVQSLMQRHMDQAAAARILATQRQAARRGADLTRRLGGQVAGTYLEPGTGRLVVDLTDSGAAATVTAAGAVPRLVTHSAATLAAATRTLDRQARVPGTSWATDPVSNQVVITVGNGVTAAGQTRLRAAAAKLGDVVRIRGAAGTPKPLLAGGDEIVADAGWICSVGFNARSGGTNYIITAGHCTAQLPNWSSGEGNVGPSVDSQFPTTDYGLIRNDGANPTAGVDLYNGSTQPISTSADATVGEQVCKSGRTTQVTCGTVQALDATVNYSEGTVYGLIETDVQAGAGDSGGALFDGDTGLGTVSGGDSSTTFFQPLSPVLAAYGVSLI